jgi:hypothetical protein
MSPYGVLILKDTTPQKHSFLNHLGLDKTYWV